MKIIGKIITGTVLLFIFTVGVFIFLGLAVGVLDAPSETGGPTIREALVDAKSQIYEAAKN